MKTKKKNKKKSSKKIKRIIKNKVVKKKIFKKRLNKKNKTPLKKKVKKKIKSKKRVKQSLKKENISKKKELKVIHAGGVTGGFLPPSKADTQLDYESLLDVGVEQEILKKSGSSLTL